MRGEIHAISDTHCEAKLNMSWLEGLPECPEDTILVAGDVAVEISQIERALCLFKQKYKHVFYCFGNHECWTSRHSFSDSFAKLAAVRSLCNSLGVKTASTLVDGVWIVPVFGWYHISWDTEPPLRPPPGMRLKQEPRAAESMSNDYGCCKWGSFQNGSEELAERLDRENETWGSWPLPEELLADARLPPGDRERPIVSFSHFLPRIELHLEKRFQMEPNLAKLIGSKWVRERVDQLRPDIHVFGHTHLCWDMRLHGVRYISWPLGMPKDKYWRCIYFPKSDCSRPLCVLDRDRQQGPRQEACFASRMYDLVERDPSSWVMAARVASKFCPSAPVLFDDVCMPGRRYPWAMPEDPTECCKMAEGAVRLKELRQRDTPVYPEWEVIGGGERGGILAREGMSLESAKLPERLSTGARVAELARRGDRLFYRLLSGTGPEIGWVATQLADRPLLEPCEMPPMPGDLPLCRILELQEALLGRLCQPKFQERLEALWRSYPGKQRTLAGFAQQHRELLQAEFDMVLPLYGFPKGNMMQLDPVIAPFCDIIAGDAKVKHNRHMLDKLMFVNSDPRTGSGIAMSA